MPNLSVGGREPSGRAQRAWSSLMQAATAKKPNDELVRRRFNVFASQVGGTANAHAYVKATKNDRLIGVITRATQGR